MVEREPAVRAALDDAKVGPVGTELAARPIPRPSSSASTKDFAGAALVAGAGPAGMAVAISLANLGQRVLVLERSASPRPSPGETLPPKIEPLLELLGVADSVREAGFARMRGFRVAAPDSVERFELDPDEGRQGFQVDRRVFDELLRNHARELGVEFREGVGLIDVDLSGPNPVAILSTCEQIRAPFVLDATGAAARTSRTLNTRERGLTRTAALTAWFSGSSTLDPSDPNEGLLEIRPDGWLYSARRSDGLRNVTIALDADAVRGAPEDAFFWMLGRSHWVGPLVWGGSRETPVLTASATRSWTRPTGHPGLLAVGDASCVIDPLTTQGVYKALCSGLAAAAVVHTSLERQADRELAAEYYSESERTLFGAYSGVMARIAAPLAASEFWSARLADYGPAPTDENEQSARRSALLTAVQTLPGPRIRARLSPMARVVERPVAENGWVVRGRKILDPTGEPLQLGECSVPALVSVLDGRALPEIFDGYAAATDTIPSAALGKSIMKALLTLAEHRALEWHTDAPQ